MSFEKLSAQDQAQLHERSCMLVYGMTKQELQLIQNAARLSGIKEWITVNRNQAGNTVKDILDDKMEETEEGILEKAVILNGISGMRVNAFIEALKKCRIKRPLIAVVTEDSLHWTVDHLVKNLAEERRALSQGNFEAHHKK